MQRNAAFFLFVMLVFAGCRDEDLDALPANTVASDAQPDNWNKRARASAVVSPSPLSGMTRAQVVEAKSAAMARVAAAQPGFRAEFSASGRDMHELPLVELSPQVRGTRSLEEATQQAALVVRGTVVAQTFEPGLLSEVAVAAVLRDQLVGSTVRIRQPGGPFLNGDTPSLMQRTSDPVLRRGREYILFLSRCVNPDVDPATGVFCTEPMPAQIEVISGRLEVHDNLRGTWLATYSGRSVVDFEKRLDP